MTPRELDSFFAGKKPKKREAPAWMRPFAKATPTEVDGIKFPSKTEARVYSELRLRAIAEKGTLYRQLRLPLWNLAPDPNKIPMRFTLDFMIVLPDGRRLCVDAKSGGRDNREWARGRAAFEACYRATVNEWDGKRSIAFVLSPPLGA